MKFSDQIGITKPNTIFQKDNINDDLKNSLWNILTSSVFLIGGYDVLDDNWFNRFRHNYAMVFQYFFKKPLDQMGSTDEERYALIRKWYFSCKWHDIYNLLEFIVDKIDNRLEYIFNDVLISEKSAYRFVEKKLIPITDEVEIESVKDAANLINKFSGPREHIRRALVAFSKKPTSDYLTATREAISAVESMAKVISGNEKGTLADALKSMEKQKTIHPALKESFMKLYGYTSDEKGIRHALLNDETDVDESIAHFMIVVCSAFLNFAISRYK